MGRGGTDSLWSSGFDGLLGRLWGGTANLEEVVERMPLVLHVYACGLCCFWHNIDHSTVCGLHKTLRVAQGGASISAEALTAADTHLL